MALAFKFAFSEYKLGAHRLLERMIEAEEMLDYRLGPERPFRVDVKHLEACYRGLVNKGTKIISRRRARQVNVGIAALGLASRTHSSETTLRLWVKSLFDLYCPLALFRHVFERHTSDQHTKTIRYYRASLICPCSLDRGPTSANNEIKGANRESSYKSAI